VDEPSTVDALTGLAVKGEITLPGYGYRILQRPGKSLAK
jgi:hypothetical protein